MTTDNERAIVDAMHTYGGSFVKALAAAWYVADDHNKQKLKMAFADYWQTYTRFVKDNSGK